MISESEDKSILFIASVFIAGNVDNIEISSIRNNNNNVKDLIEETIDTDEYRKLAVLLFWVVTKVKWNIFLV